MIESTDSMILQKRFVQKLQHIHVRPLLRALILINMRTYVGGSVRTGAYNLILIFDIIMLPGHGPGPVLCIDD